MRHLGAVRVGRHASYGMRAWASEQLGPSWLRWHGGIAAPQGDRGGPSAPLECVEQPSTRRIRPRRPGGPSCGAAGRPAWPASTGCCTWPARPAADHSSPHPRRSETPRPTWMGHRRWHRRAWAGARKRSHHRSFSSAPRLCGEGPLLTSGPEGSREQAGGPLERWVGARRAAASPARPGRVMLLCRLPRKPRSA